MLGEEYTAYLLLFLFEELKLDARIDKAYDVLRESGRGTLGRVRERRWTPGERGAELRSEKRW